MKLCPLKFDECVQDMCAFYVEGVCAVKIIAFNLSKMRREIEEDEMEVRT